MKKLVQQSMVHKIPPKNYYKEILITPTAA